MRWASVYAANRAARFTRTSKATAKRGRGNAGWRAGEWKRCIITIVYSTFGDRAANPREKGDPPPPHTKTSRKSASQYLRLLSSHGKNVSPFRQAHALSSLFIIQVKGNSGEEGVFFLNVNQRNKFLCRLNFPSFRLCASRPTGYSATSKTDRS